MGAHQSWALISLLLVVLGLGSSSALRCYSCDDARDPWCKYLQSPSDTTTQIECGATVTDCYHISALDGSGGIRRGCLDPEAITCDSSNSDAVCASCSSDLCNSDQLGFEECVSCDSELHADCVVPTSLTSTVQCDQATVDKAGCYRQSDSWGSPRVRRGCASHLDEVEFGVCSQNADSCKICHGDSCNIKDTYQRCVVCDSEDDPGCLQRLAEDGFDKYKKICTDYLDSCASYVIPGGKTARGCLKEIDPEPTFCPSTNCDICTTTDCNYRVVPTTRVLCFQCASNSEGSCVSLQEPTFNNQPTVCPLFYFDDQCYRFLDEKTDVSYRGCIRNSPAIAADCELYPQRCARCTGHGCNIQAIKTAPELSCYTCDKDDEACPWHFRNEVSSAECQQLVPFYSREQCYSYQHADQTVERGCVVDKPEVCADSSQCTICTNNNCNGWGYMAQSCVYCNSQEGNEAYSPFCEKEAEKVPPTSCSLITYERRGCYSYRDSNNVVSRGCYDGFYYGCDEENKEWCTRCYEDNCNTNEQGAGFALKASAIITGALVGVTMMIANMAIGNVSLN